jgi:hypothetical protein
MRGRKMANSIAAFLFKNFFFPGMKDKKVAQIKEMFLNDMQFNLTNGEASQTTRLFNDSYEKVSLRWFRIGSEKISTNVQD